MTDWKKRDRVDGDPFWEAKLGEADLVVGVECEWCFSWSVETPDDSDVARGSVYIPEGDALGDDAWDYQHVERAQARCEAVARAVLGEAYVFTGYVGFARADGKLLAIDCGDKGVIEIRSADNLWSFYCKNVRVTLEITDGE